MSSIEENYWEAKIDLNTAPSGAGRGNEPSYRREEWSEQMFDFDEQRNLY